MDINSILWTVLITLLIIIISALPLHLAVVFLGGRSSILKAFLVMLVVGVLSAVIVAIFPFGVLIAWIFMIWIFHEMFRLKWIKAVIAWVLWLVFIFLMTFILALFGISFAAFSLLG